MYIMAPPIAPPMAPPTAATEQLEAIGSHINEYIRQHENFHKMLSIQNSLTGDSVPTILVPGRRFIKEGRLMKVCIMCLVCTWCVWVCMCMQVLHRLVSWCNTSLPHSYVGEDPRREYCTCFQTF